MAAGAALAVGAALAALLVYARAVEPRRLRTPVVELELPHWPTHLDGLRVALIADLHAGGPHAGTARLDRIVAAVAATHPDLVLVLGDLVDPNVRGGSRVAPDLVARRLARLRTPGGTVAVLGNHDWHSEGATVGVALRHAGITVLEDAAVATQVRGTPLWVAGLSDLRERDPRVGQALKEIPEGAPILLLSHDPDAFGLVPARVALTVAGHLHGGQVNLPGLRVRAMPTRHGTRYQAGHVVEGGRHLFVSRGLGESGRPWRLGAVPEAPILVLRARAPAATGR